MPTTLTDITEMVNERVADFTEFGNDVATSDGVKAIYPLTDRYIVASSVTVYATEDGVSTLVSPSAYIVHADSGYLQWLQVPDEGVVINIYYQFKHWPDSLIQRSANLALDALWPQFYVKRNVTTDDDDDTLTTSPDTQNYVIPSDVEIVLGIELKVATIWEPNQRWYLNEGANEIMFNYAPPSATMRLDCVCRPEPFSETVTTLEGTGLPRTALEPVVLYCVWQLYKQGVLRRARGAGAVEQQGEGANRLDNLTALANTVYQEFLMSKQANAMQPWTGGSEMSY